MWHNDKQAHPSPAAVHTTAQHYDFLKAIGGQKLVVKHCWIKSVRSNSKKLTLPTVVRQRSLALAFTTIWVMGHKSPTTVHSVGFRLGDPNTLEDYWSFIPHKTTEQHGVYMFCVLKQRWIYSKSVLIIKWSVCLYVCFVSLLVTNKLGSLTVYYHVW